MTYAMENSDMDPKWIEEMWAKFPCMRILDANGEPNGNFRTGPVRGAFLNVLTRSPVKQTKSGTIGGKFQATALFPPAADISVLKQAATECALAKWPTAGDPDPKKRPSLHTPFRQQDEKIQLDGYTSGGVFITATADKRAPYAVNAQGAPIVDEALIKPGAWYLFVLRPFDFTNDMKKGVSFGLQGLMKIADDIVLGGGGGSDPRSDFAGVAIDTSAQAAAVNPAGLF